MSDKYQELMDCIEAQEKALSVDGFTNEDALKLGCFLLDYSKETGLVFSVAIRRPNGEVLFHHLPAGTNNNNQNWMRRKYNTVNLWSHASLYGWAHEHIVGETLADHGRSTEDYVHCGGGFPLFLKDGVMVAIVTISNLPHYKDHQVLVDGIAKWLGRSDVPKIDYSTFE